MLTVLQQPNILNPLNASVWYKVNSNLNQLVDFKYVFDVYIKNKSTGTNETYLGRFEAPPRPGDGAGFFSPHKAVRAMAYREVEADLTTPVLAEPNFERFAVNIGESIPQNFDYYDTYFASSFVAFTFSYQHSFVNGQVLFNTQDNSEGFGININPEYEGTFSITSVPNDFAIITNIPWNLSTPQQTGIITIPFADTWDYISTNGTIGITFSGPHTLQAGDVIEIDKDDKTWNTWLDGEWEVLQVESRSVRLNRGVPLGATYGVGVDSGFITKVTRFGHTGTSKWGYLGTRQYDELNVDFSPQFYCGPQYLSSNGATAASWMTDFEGRKPTWGEEETSSIFLQAGVWYPILTFTTSGGSPVSYQQIFTASVTGQYHFPSGVPNVETYWGVSLSGVKNYEIYLSAIAIL